MKFSPFIENLDEIIKKPPAYGDWITIYGSPGTLKTFHALALCLSAINEGNNCIYISALERMPQILQKIAEWRKEVKSINARWGDKDDKNANYNMIIIDPIQIHFWLKSQNKNFDIFSFDSLYFSIMKSLRLLNIIQYDAISNKNILALEKAGKSEKGKKAIIVADIIDAFIDKEKAKQQLLALRESLSAKNLAVALISSESEDYAYARYIADIVMHFRNSGFPDDKIITIASIEKHRSSDYSKSEYFIIFDGKKIKWANDLRSRG